MKIQFRVLHDGKTFEGEAVLAEPGSSVVSRRSATTAAISSGSSKPSGAIDGLYEKRFFGTERTLGTVMEQLRADGYNFGGPSVLMALKSRGYLRRGGSKGSYRFVQKFPPKD
jgi:hypothetical protein